MQIIIIDHHSPADARVERHQSLVSSNDNRVIRLNFSKMGRRSGLKRMVEINGNLVTFLPLTSSTFGRLFIINLFCLFPKLFSIFYIKTSFFSEFVTDSPTVIHVHDPAMLSLARELRRGMFKKSIIVYDRHEVFEHAGGLYGKLSLLFERLNSRFVDAVVGISLTYVQDNLHRFPKARHSIAIPNYPCLKDYDKIRIENKISNLDEQSEILISYVGSLSHKYDRDLDLILNVMKATIDSNHNVKAVLAGKTDCQHLLKRINDFETECGDRFRYLGYVTREEAVKISENSHIGLFFIRPESKYWVKSSPNKFYEYLATGTIAIVRADIDYNGGNGPVFFSRNESKDKIIEWVASLVHDTSRIRCLMEYSYRESTKYSFDSVGEKYLRLYENLIGSE